MTDQKKKHIHLKLNPEKFKSLNIALAMLGMSKQEYLEQKIDELIKTQGLENIKLVEAKN